MEFLNSRKFILIMLIVLVWIGLQSCVYKTSVPTPSKEVEKPIEKEKPHTVIDSVSKMQGVANALVCIFAPETCDSSRKK